MSPTRSIRRITITDGASSPGCTSLQLHARRTLGSIEVAKQRMGRSNRSTVRLPICPIGPRADIGCALYVDENPWLTVLQVWTTVYSD